MVLEIMSRRFFAISLIIIGLLANFVNIVSAIDSDTTIYLSEQIILFILWILLFGFWFDAKTPDMNILLSIILVPYTIFFIWYALPLFGITNWIVSAVFGAIALSTMAWSIDMKVKVKKEKEDLE